jgi:hypothetical protein
MGVKPAGAEVSDLIKRLRAPVNWLRQEPGEWKSATSSYDRAPYEAADIIESQARRIGELTAMLDSARDYMAEGGLCGRMVGARELVNEIDAQIDALSAERATEEGT